MDSSFPPVFQKRARSAAILWTLLILLGCLWPGRELPEVQVPLADKWVHFLMFGIFSVLWLFAGRTTTAWRLPLMLLLTAAFGYTVELLQYALPFLHRSFDHYDALADTIGGALGILAYALLRPAFKAKS